MARRGFRVPLRRDERDDMMIGSNRDDLSGESPVAHDLRTAIARERRSHR